MTANHQSSSAISTETNTENSCQRCQIECVTKSVMALEERLSEEPVIEEIAIEKWTEDASSSSSEDTDDEDCLSEPGQEIVAPDASAGNFGNIVVTNSSDVHFGNNTFYQYEGPVTIKQFVYKSENSDKKLAIQNGAKDSFIFQPETLIEKDEECIERDQKLDVQNIVNIDEGEHNIETSQGIKWLNKLYKKRNILAIGLTVVFIIILTIIFVNKKKEDIPSEWWEESNLSGQLKIIPRKEWFAESPKATTALNHPVPTVIISETVAESCTNRGKCTQYIQYLQFHHKKDKRWTDIAYNFLIGGDGYVYEGRGWNYAGSHSYGSVIGWNSKSIGISFIGTFDVISPPDQQILAAKLLIEEGVKKNYIAADYKLFAYRQIVSNVINPGETLYENIKLWPRWTNESFV